ncbi:MAG: SGNH/GDSL hydrolase family protein [Lachnospiraceae bacterium]|nr:SGNH/GDSL hydrolase family protein [Lachnospiraceae bacterium]
MKNIGNDSRIKKVMKRAAKGEPVTIGFIGGSITQGAVASDEALCYAARVFGWWKKTFDSCEVKYVNAGIGATTSQFGVSRVESDLLKYDPDFVIVEFSVNDNDEKPYDRSVFFKETYEGLIRKIYYHKNMKTDHPAVLIVNSVRYDDGGNMEDVHSEIGSYYDIPCISMKELIYEKVKAGKAGFEFKDITRDMLHPNDYGHSIVAGHIINYLEGVMKRIDTENDKSEDIVKPPLTVNGYEDVIRYNIKNFVPVCNGFYPDTSDIMFPFFIKTELQDCLNDLSVNSVQDKALSSEVRDVFKNGWSAGEKGASIEFRVKGSELAVMYRKSVKKPAPIAKAIVDDDMENAVVLDANFDEDWGDKAYLQTIGYHMDDHEHKLEIRIEDAEDCIVDFYLINVICG